ncbi:sulfatase-like hydrolase/transferase [bacterium]|nr:sulfatase-like hydrolase/transferase [bacterium]
MKPVNPTVAIISVLLSLAGFQAAFGNDRNSRPNIVFVLVDDLGRNDIGFESTKPEIAPRTPNIDSIFRDGVSFRNFYANSPVCSPTRASLMTGLYSDRAGVPGVIRQNLSDSWGHLRPDVTTLPEILKSQGYATFMVGKWHLGYSKPNRPVDRGFESFRGFLGDMMDNYFDHRRGGINWMRHNETEIDPPGHATDLFSDWAVEAVREGATANRPFFLYLAYNAPHSPIQPPPKMLEKVKSERPHLGEKRASLVALIEHLDDGVGRVLAAIREAGIERQTLVIFTSDNGGQLDLGADNGPWRGTKGETFEGGLRVVCGARWPERVPAGLKSNVVSMTADWYATLAEIVGADHSKLDLDAKSLMRPLIHPSDTAGFDDREIYFVRREGGPAFAGKTIEGLRAGRWKLVLNRPTEPIRLFDLETDPFEMQDLAAKNPTKFREMIARIQLHIQRGGQIPWQSRTGVQE